MKIGFSTSVIQRGKSGVGRYVLSLAKALLRLDLPHEFCFFVLEEDLPLFQFAAGSARLIPVPERFRDPVKNIWWHQTRLPALIKKHGIDLLHVPSYRRMLWPQPCRLVSTIHDLAAFHVAGKYDFLRMFYGRVVVKHLARRQHSIIAVSQNTARDISRFFGIPLPDIRVIYNGLDHSRFFPGSRGGSQDMVARRHGVSGPFFLYVARLEHPAKNHTQLIEAYHAFRAKTKLPWKLVFAGSDWHGAEVIHQAVRSSPHSADIKSLGFVPDQELPDLYRAAEALVYPSLHEGFGLPPLEAMACGCPVASSLEGALWEVVVDAAAIFDPKDPSSIAIQLERLATEEAFRENLRRAGRLRAKCFNWEDAARQTLGVYSETEKPCRKTAALSA